MEFLGSFLITMVSSWSLYSLKQNIIGYMGFGIIDGLLLGILIWIGVVESGAHFNPIVTIGNINLMFLYDWWSRSNKP